MSSNEKRKEFAKIFPELPLDKLINKIETDTMAGEIIEIVEAENEVLSVRTDLNQTPAIELSPLLPFTLSKQLETI